MSVRRALAQPASTPAEHACKPVVPVQVRAVSAGEGFWILLESRDERAATALLRWAREVATAATLRR